jgi:L-asparaginase
MTDAMFNIGMAIAAVQTMDHGVYIAINGTVFPAKSVIKSRNMNRFEGI